MSRKAPRSKSTTRFDYRQRNIIFAAVGILTLVAGGLGSLLYVNQPDATSHAEDIRPRNTDIWALYPDDSVRAVTLIFPEENPDSRTDAEVVEVAGPLFHQDDDIQASEVIGGQLSNSEVRAGAEFFGGEDSQIAYELFRITRRIGLNAYGTDVTATNSPYLSESTEAAGLARTVVLGTKTGSSFASIIVVVALPTDTEILENAGMESYRTVAIRGWDLYYFDTSQTTGAEIIQITYIPISDASPPDFNPLRIDRKR